MWHLWLHTCNKGNSARGTFGCTRVKEIVSLMNETEATSMQCAVVVEASQSWSGQAMLNRVRVKRVIFLLTIS